MSDDDHPQSAVENWKLDVSPRLLDPSVVTPQSNFGSLGPCRNIVQQFTDFCAQALVWQPDVYKESTRLAERYNLTTILDFGCGSGEKLVEAFDAHTYKTIGFDFLNSFRLASTLFPDREWIEVDLTDNQSVDDLGDTLVSRMPALIILSDFLEHLVDVRPVLRLVRTLLLCDASARAVITTPDRARLHYTERIPPRNAAHCREWTLAELTRLLLSAGFQIDVAGHTRANSIDTELQTCFVVVSANPKLYQELLEHAQLACRGSLPQHLLITTELHGVVPAGGIGAFIEEQQWLYRDSCLTILASAPPEHTAQKGKYIPVSRLVPPSHHDFPIEDQVLLALEQILFYVPGLQTIQFQDYQGIGYRIAQAKRAAIIPGRISTIVHCHGNTHYLENAAQEWTHSESLTAEKEKISIELSDVAVFPSDFLRQLYCEIGILPKHGILRPYPFRGFLENEPDNQRAALDPITSIVFYGKRSKTKGVDLFVDALSRPKLDLWWDIGIREIIFLSPKEPTPSDWNETISKLGDVYRVREIIGLDRAAAINHIASIAASCVVVLPYRADNYPYSVYDIVATGAVMIAANAGGIPEMVHEHCLFAPTAGSLREKLADVLTTDRAELDALYQNMRAQLTERQRLINNEHLFASPSCCPRTTGVGLTSTVIIPFFNTDMRYVRELMTALEQQSRAPDEIIIIDDGSNAEARAALLSFVSEKDRIIRLIHHPENKGLASARNTGLQAASGDIVINIDSDDLPMNDFIRDIMRYLEQNADAAAAVPYSAMFEDGSDFQSIDASRNVYRPLGDGVIGSLSNNNFGHANGGVRKNIVTARGGWDELDRSMHEDYGLYMNLISSGHSIGIIPKVGCLYRVRAGSMLRTGSRWEASRRIARNTVGLPRFDAFRLQAMTHVFASELEKVRSSARLKCLEEIGAVHQMYQNSTSWRVTSGLRAVSRVLRYLWGGD